MEIVSHYRYTFETRCQRVFLFEKQHSRREWLAVVIQFGKDASIQTLCFKLTVLEPIIFAVVVQLSSTLCLVTLLFRDILGFLPQETVIMIFQLYLFAKTLGNY